MALAPGTVVEGQNGRRGEVVSDDVAPPGQAAGSEGTVPVRWAPMQALPEETRWEPENSIRVVPEEELGNEPLSPGKGWPPDGDIPWDPIRH